MKKILLSLVVLFGIQSVLYAQNEKYIQSMKTQIAILDTAQTEPFLLKNINTFERISSVEPKEWLPIYYSSLAESRLAMIYMQKDQDKADTHLNKALATLEKAEALSADNSEIITLKAMIVGMQIGIDPMTRGQKLGMQAAMLTSQALALNPENPRAIALKGQMLLFTPPQFGGDPAKGKELLNKALEKIDTFKPESELHPTWGKEMIKSFMTVLDKFEEKK